MADRTPPQVSVLAPAHNEEESVGPLIREIVAALDGTRRSFEIVVVDDGSTDATAERLRALLPDEPRLRVIALTGGSSGRAAGQSAALRAGIEAARGEIVAMLDADGQNDPAELPRLLDLLESTGADLVQGDRSAVRQDGPVRSASSWVGRMARRMLLGDAIRDTGCSLRVMRRAVALALPLEFRGMHRFIPVTVRDLGHQVIETPVRHRPRTAGRTKYGVWNRALPALVDCFAVRWMRARRRPTTWAPLEADRPLGARRRPSDRMETAAR